MARLLIFPLIITLLAACSALSPTVIQPSPSPVPPDEPVVSTEPVKEPSTPIGLDNPYSPQEGDQSLTRAEVMLQSKDLLIRESYPPQYAVALKGALPTPCHRLRLTIQGPDAQAQVNLEVYSLVDPNEICIQVLEPLDAVIELTGYPPGKYDVLVNGEKIGEMDVPEPLTSMKGIELYSWQSGETWYFAVLPGTNRLKTWEEVTQEEGRLAGIERLKTALRRLPKGEQVFWVRRGIPGMSMPPESMVEEIVEYCQEIGLQLEVVD